MKEDKQDGYIRYSNEEERKAAIAQAEGLGFVKWKDNDVYRSAIDDCISMDAKDGTWIDVDHKESIDAGFSGIPLTPPTPLIDLNEHYIFSKQKYNKTVSEDNTVTLKPKKKVKVWIEVYLYEGQILVTYHDTKNEAELSIKESLSHYNIKHLDLIEKEYEI